VSLKGATPLITGPASAVGRAITAGSRATERRTIPIAIRRPIPTEPIAAEGGAVTTRARAAKRRAVAAGPIATKRRALTVAPAAVERGPIALRPPLRLLTLVLGSASAKGGPVTARALIKGTVLLALEGRAAIAVAKRGAIPTLLERGPFAVLAKGTALPALERGPFRPSALWDALLERGPFATPPGFVRLVTVAAILAAREGPIATLLACVKAALLGPG
jgi:hypothetical protein